jgi:hypothetical protein
MFKKRAPGTLLLLYYAEKLHGRSVFGYVAIGHLHLLLAGKAVISISCGTINIKLKIFAQDQINTVLLSTHTSVCC